MFIADGFVLATCLSTAGTPWISRGGGIVKPVDVDDHGAKPLTVLDACLAFGLSDKNFRAKNDIS